MARKRTVLPPAAATSLSGLAPTLPAAEKAAAGKSSAAADPRTLQFSAYMDTANLPVPPDACDWASLVAEWPLYRSDKVNDCTCAAAAHMIIQWTTYARGATVVPSESDVIGTYSDLTGFDPETSANNARIACRDLLNHWRLSDVAERSILGYTALEARNPFSVKDAVYLFGSCYMGFELPLSAIDQWRAGQPWSVLPEGAIGRGARGSWGGHAVAAVAYTPRELLCVSWGRTVRVSWQFWETYCDEAYAVLSEDWIDGGGYSPGHFNLIQLKADLAALG